MQDGILVRQVDDDDDAHFDVGRLVLFEMVLNLLIMWHSSKTKLLVC